MHSLANVSRSRYVATATQPVPPSPIANPPNSAQLGGIPTTPQITSESVHETDTET